MNELKQEDAEYISQLISNYFDRFERIDEFFVNDKMDKMKKYA